MESRKGVSDVTLDKGTRATSDKGAPKRYSDARQQHHQKREERNQQRKDAPSQGDKVEESKENGSSLGAVEKSADDGNDSAGARGDQGKKEEPPSSSKQESTKDSKNDGKGKDPTSESQNSGQKGSLSGDRKSPSNYERDQDRGRGGPGSHDSSRSGKNENQSSEAEKKGSSHEKKKDGGDKHRDSDREERKREEASRESKPRKESERESKSRKDSEKESRPRKDGDREGKARRESDKESKPRRDSDKESKPRRDNDKESKPRRDSDKESKPRRDSDKESKPRKDSDRDSKPRRDGDRESKPRRDSDKEAKTEKTSAKESKKKEEKSQEEKDAEEAARIEAEKQREKELEEERKRLEEEERLRKEEEEKQIAEEEMKSIREHVDEVKEKIETKMALRQQNSMAAENRPDDSFFSRLDSNLKKNTAFVRKLRNLTEAQKDSLAKDFNSLNLSKYIGECAAALTDAKLKMSDVACGVHICSLLHQRYSDFSSNLLENWVKVLPSKKDDKIANPSKLRVDLRFFADLVSSSVFTEKEGLPILSAQLSILISGDKEEHNNLSIIISFCKHCGDDYAGLVPRKFRLLSEKYQAEIPRSQVLKADRQKACRKLFTDYYNSLCRHLTKDHKNLKTMEKNNLRTLMTKGELSNERKEKFEAAQQSYQKLLSNTIQFSDILDEDMPELPEDEPSEQDKLGMDLFSPMKGEYQYEGDLTLFEDEETRQFYENLPDLKAIVPGILYKDSENVAPPAAESLEEAATTLEEDMKNLKVEDVEKEIEEQEKELKALDSKEKEKEKEKENGDAKVTEDKKDAKAEDVPPEQLELLQTDVEEDDTNMCMKLLLDSFLQGLPNCVNRELIDKAAVEFCMNLNTKANRKKLVKAMFTVQRTRYDLLPFYARLVAILHPCMPDIAHELNVLLTGDFKWHVRKKDQINIESKLKTVRFIGELVKFSMFPKADALHFLKMLLFDFSHHNIDMACSLLESCGRYLYRSLESHHRTKVYLEVMIRKKNFLHLDGRYTTMIENAYYYSNPPEVKQVERKVRPPMHQYIRKLLYKDLSKLTVEKVLRQTRKLNWEDSEIEFYATKCLTAVWNVRYHNIHCLANLLAGLAPYHENVAINVVDGVLEDIRVGMEVNIAKFNQRRVSTITFLGELYNYRMVESSVIFKILYSLITFGVTLDDSISSDFDPPDHLFRIRLVCVLLDTCGQYFDHGSSKKKLDYFLIYFQRYYWFKKKHEFWLDPRRRFPIDVDNMFRDSLETVRPKMKLTDSFEEACKAADELDNEFRAKLSEIIPLKDVDFTDAGGDMDGLQTIQESDEMDEHMSLSLSQLRMTDEDPSTAESDGEDRSGRSGSQLRSLTQEMDHDHEGSGEEMMESAGEEDTDEICVLTGGPKLVKCQEDEDFMAAFDKIMVESVQSRIVESAKASQVDIALPMHLKGQAKPKAPLVTGSDGSASFLLPPSESTEQSNSINFTLMTKKGNKPQYATVNVPITSELATKYIQRENAEREEKERMKRVVLDIHERQEEEDYQEMIAGMNKTPPVNVNRERKVKYQHPKGAPDADAIFGSKRR